MEHLQNRRRSAEYFSYEPTEERSNSPILTFLLIILALLIYDLASYGSPQQEESFQSLNFTAIEIDLLHKVHQQKDALEIVMKSLKQLHIQNNLNVLNFVGSNGVGKTFVANILKRHFEPHVFELNGPLDRTINKETTIVTSLGNSNQNFNFLIVDDLTVSDVDNLLSFLTKLPKDVAVFVVCIFNIQDTDGHLNYTINFNHIEKIREKFEESKIKYNLAHFHHFDRKNTKDWLIRELSTKRVDAERHNTIIESILDYHDIKFHGFKGLGAKMDLAIV